MLQVTGIRCYIGCFENDGYFYKYIQILMDLYEGEEPDWIGITNFYVVECDGIPLLFLDYDNSDITDYILDGLPDFNKIFNVRRELEAAKIWYPFDSISDGTGLNYKTLIHNIITNFRTIHKHSV